MSHRFKIFFRNLLPARYQVPIKYWNDWQRGVLEEEMKILGLIVQSGDRVIDVGGNRGIYAYQFWRLGATVEVFEPNPVCSSILTAWAAGKPAVHVHAVGLSNCSGQAVLHIPIDESGVEHDASASIENTGFSLARDQLVVLQALDSFRFEDVRLIKIDVEGHEYSVVEGAEKTLAASKPALLVEIEQRHIARPISDVFEKILGLGYQGFFMMKGKLMSLQHFEVTRYQSMDNFGEPNAKYINNFLFLHRDRFDNGEYSVLFKGSFLK